MSELPRIFDASQALTTDAKLPPHPLDGQWHMHVDGITYGPFTGRQLREFAKEGRLNAGTDVFSTGSEVWTRACDDPVLRSFFPSTPPLNRQASVDGGHVSAGAGGTIVQITNTTAAAPQRPTIVLDDGLAKPKSAGTALLLSFLIVGVGQFYNGQIAKGILMMIGCVLLWFVLLGWIVNFWSIIDAYLTARNMNDRYQRRLAAGMII